MSPTLIFFHLAKFTLSPLTSHFLRVCPFTLHYLTSKHIIPHAPSFCREPLQSNASSTWTDFVKSLCQLLRRSLAVAWFGGANACRCEPNDKRQTSVYDQTCLRSTKLEPFALQNLVLPPEIIRLTQFQYRSTKFNRQRSSPLRFKLHIWLGTVVIEAHKATDDGRCYAAGLFD